MTVRVVWVLTCSDDPFVAGGVPFAVYDNLRLAWDRLAEEVALHAQIAWSKPHVRGRRTRDQVMADEASAFDIHPVVHFPAAPLTQLFRDSIQSAHRFNSGNMTLPPATGNAFDEEPRTTSYHTHPPGYDHSRDSESLRHSHPPSEFDGHGHAPEDCPDRGMYE